MPYIYTNFLYSFARVCITLQQIELRSSRVDTLVAEEQGYLDVHFARLGSLVVIVIFVGSCQAFISGSNEP